MPADKYERLVKALERLGIATVICGALMWGIWEVFCWTGANVAKPLVEEQVAMMKWVRESGGRRDKNEERTTAVLARLTRFLERAEKAVGIPEANEKPIAVQPKGGEKEPDL